jgi:peptidoglycan hydrolase-like amidase
MQKERTHIRHHFQFFNVVYLAILLIPLFIMPRVSNAEETIRVLMAENMSAPLPSEQAESVGDVTGKVFINGKFYTGSLEVLRDEKGLYVIKNLPLEKYIEDLLVSETKKDWELEAIKARAVISRTNAHIYRANNAGSKYHIVSTLPHLLYRGENKDPFVSRAVKATKDEILTYKGLPVKTLFYLTETGESTLPVERRQGLLDMAREGKGYKEILGHYYPGTTIVNTKKMINRSKQLVVKEQ